jgi:hypothetical protein
MAYLFSKKVPMNSEEAINATVELVQIANPEGRTTCRSKSIQDIT